MARVPIPTGATVTDEPAAPAPAGRVPIPAGAKVEDDPGYTAAQAGKDLLQGTAKVLQGATGGLSDEIAGGTDAAIFAVKKLVSGELPSRDELKRVYVERRDQERKLLEQASADHPIVSAASELGGSFLMPTGAAGAAAKVATKATGLGQRALSAAKSLAPLAAAGGVAGVGYQDSGEGQIATPAEIGEGALKGAATGAAAGAAIKATGAAARAVLPVVKKPYLWLANRLGRGPEEIKAAILDEVATTANGKQVRETVKKHLAKAGDAIYDEIITGPEARTVQKAYQAKTGADGLKILQPVIDRLDGQREQLYGAFEKAGAHVVDLANEYVPRLTKASEAARRAGDKHMADGLEGIAEMVTAEGEKTVKAGGETSMAWLRAHTTALQAAAASKIGGLEDHETAKLARHVAEEAKGVLDEVFIAKAGKDPALQAAGQGIKDLNRRYYANLTLKDALEARSVKEGVSGGPVERAVKKLGSLPSIGSGGAGAAVGFAVGGPAGAAVGGALGTRAPAIARSVDRKLTSVAVDRLREAAAGRGGVGPSQAIKAVARDYELPEPAVRAAYVRLILGGDKSAEASSEAR